MLSLTGPGKLSCFFPVKRSSVLDVDTEKSTVWWLFVVGGDKMVKLEGEDRVIMELGRRPN